MAATWPFTVALADPIPTGPFCLIRVHSSSSTSPGVTWRLEAGVFDAAEEGDLTPVLRHGQQGHRTHLGQSLQNEHTGHHVVLGEMAARKRAH